MPYDAFLSYKSDDRAWAERLFQELRADGLQVFWDWEHLRAGVEWQPQLEKALSDSKALVVLWSSRAAKMNNWVDQERFLFDRDELKTLRGKGRRPVIYVLLDEDPAALGATHHVRDLREVSQATKPSDVPEAIWKSIRRKVRDGIEPEGQITVKTVVLAATPDELTEQKLGQKRWSNLTQLLGELGLENEFAVRYGTNRWDWRPYGQATVTDILEQLERGFLEDRGLKLRFKDIQDDLWTSANPHQAILELSRDLALVIIDPLSLFEWTIAQRFALLRPCLKSPTNAFAVLSPRASTDDALNVLLETQVADLYSGFFNPPIPPPENSPSVGFNIRSPRELLRVLIFALARKRMPHSSDNRNAIFSVESGS